MNIQIQSVRENPLLERRQVTLEVKHEEESTPSREDIKDRFAAEKTLNVESVEVGTINTGYGSNSSTTKLKVYEQFDYEEGLQEQDNSEEIEVKTEYTEVVEGTITEAKEEIGDMEDPSYDALIKAENENKNRTTLIDWLENQK